MRRRAAAIRCAEADWQLRCVVRSVHVCLGRRLGTRWQADIALGMLSSLLPLLQDGLRLRLRVVASHSQFLGQQFRTPGHVSRRCVIVMVIGRWYLVSRHVPSLREELLGRIPVIRAGEDLRSGAS